MILTALIQKTDENLNEAHESRVSVDESNEVDNVGCVVGQTLCMAAKLYENNISKCTESTFGKSLARKFEESNDCISNDKHELRPKTWTLRQ